MIAIFLDEAREEMIEAARFYEERRTGLGQQFLDIIEQAVADVEAHPNRWPVLARNVRRRLVSKFPYGILFCVGREEIVIVAIMHLHRHPRYWTRRLRGLSGN